MLSADKMLAVGDTIKCADAEEAAELVGELAVEGIDTDFRYEQNGERGIWLVVTEVNK